MIKEVVSHWFLRGAMIFLIAFCLFYTQVCAVAQGGYAETLTKDCYKFAEDIVSLVSEKSSAIDSVMEALVNPSSCETLPDPCKVWVQKRFFVPVELYSLARLIAITPDENYDSQSGLLKSRDLLKNEAFFRHTYNATSKDLLELKDLEAMDGVEECLKNFKKLDHPNPATEILMTIKSLLTSIRSMNVKEKAVMIGALAQKLKSLVEVTSSLEFLLKDCVSSYVPYRKIDDTVYNMDWLFFWKDYRNLLKVLPLKEELEGKDMTELLEALFSKQVVDKFKKDHAFESLKTLEGFEEICQMAETHVAENVIEIGGPFSISNSRAWAQLELDFIKSFSVGENQYKAIRALAEIGKVLARDYKGNARERDLYKLVAMCAMFDDLECEQKEHQVFQIKHYANIVQLALRGEAYKMQDSRAQKIIEFISLAKKDMPLFVIKSPNAIYPAYACLWAAKQKAGLIGCPFAPGLDASKLEAHGGLFKQVLQLLVHDRIHIFRLFEIPLTAPINNIDELCHCLRRSELKPMTPYYLLLCLAMAYNDRSLTDKETFELLERFLDNPEHGLRHEDDLRKVLMRSLLESCSDVLKKWAPYSMQMLAVRSYVVNHLEILNRVSRKEDRFPYGLYVFLQYTFHKHREYTLWAESFCNKDELASTSV